MGRPPAVPQDFRHVSVKAQDGNRTGLFARERDHLRFPINVPGFKERQIRLRRAQVPRQLIERLAFGILLALNNFAMFLPGDGALFLEPDFRPLPFDNHRPRQPGHVQREVVQPPQINIRGHCAVFQHAQKMFRARFQHRQTAKAVKGFVLDGRLPAVLRLPLLELDHFIHDELPVAGGDFGIAGGQIRPRDLQVHGGLLHRFLARVKQPQRRRAVGCVQAVLLASRHHRDVVTSTFISPIESVSLSHNCFFSDQVTTIDFDPVSE